MSLSIDSSRSLTFSIWRHQFEQSFKGYVRLNCNYFTKIRKEDR